MNCEEAGRVSFTENNTENGRYILFIRIQSSFSNSNLKPEGEMNEKKNYKNEFVDILVLLTLKTFLLHYYNKHLTVYVRVAG